MEKNLILKSAILLCQSLLVVFILIWCTFIFILIHSLFSSGAYSDLIVTDGFKSGWGMNLYYCEGCVDNYNISLNSLSNSMKLWLGIRGSIFILILILIVTKCLKVLRSVRVTNTFYLQNIRNFQYMALYGSIGFLLSSFNFITTQTGTFWDFTFAFGPLVFSLGSLVLSEVFKQGKLLLEDKNSIV